MSHTCIFCRIVAGEAPAEIVFESEDTIFFYDVTPKARVHIIGIPKRHVSSIDALAHEDQQVVGQLLGDVPKAVRKTDIDPEEGYRVITNVGPHGGQQVFHIHFHIMGGEPVGPLRAV